MAIQDKKPQSQKHGRLPRTTFGNEEYKTQSKVMYKELGDES
jgi:hypothetical protein